MTQRHIVFDVEVLGRRKPVFLVCTICRETGERNAYWFHKRGHMKKLTRALLADDVTWVGFNSKQFDVPMVSAATDGVEPEVLKEMATALIVDGLGWWESPRTFDFEMLELDHIDLFDVAPGVKISLKTYGGRMGMKDLIDLPYGHDEDLTPEQLKEVEMYCFNDCETTLELFERLQTEISLRQDLSAEFDLDLRSRSDAQLAEAVLKREVGIGNRDKIVPTSVEYSAPAFIQTNSDTICNLIKELESIRFRIDRANGNLVAPEFLKDPIKVGSGSYQCGVGGLHSTHDVNLYRQATDKICISDFDVASYYPNIMLKAGIVPTLAGNKGDRFLETYESFYLRRLEAKRSGNKRVSNSLKIFLNGTFGKLGSIFCAFYAPEMLLAVTITGQLNLLCLIYDLEKLRGVRVLSANTDGIMVEYPPKARERVLKVFAKNAKRTEFEYEETPYKVVAMKDVNNYMAITAASEAAVISSGAIARAVGKGDVIKSKGLYASNRPDENPLYLMKNPTMEVCSRLVADYLRHGTLPEKGIKAYTDIRDFVAIRNVKGGGVQHVRTETVDDWVLVDDVGTKDNLWMRQIHIDEGRSPWDQGGGPVVRRKSRPAPVEVGVGGKPFGRVARWYMTTKTLPPITYVGSGNKVPKTEGARLCMALPEVLPEDLDRDWYVRETYSMLADMGVQL